MTPPAGFWNPPGTAGFWQGLWAAGASISARRFCWAAAWLRMFLPLGQSAGVFCRSGRRPYHGDRRRGGRAAPVPGRRRRQPLFPFSADSYLTVEHPFDTLPAILVCAVSSASLISDLRFSQAVFWGLILLSAFSVAFTLLFLHRRVTKPLKDLRGEHPFPAQQRL